MLYRLTFFAVVQILHFPSSFVTAGTRSYTTLMMLSGTGRVAPNLNFRLRPSDRLLAWIDVSAHFIHPTHVACRMFDALHTCGHRASVVAIPAFLNPSAFFQQSGSSSRLLCGAPEYIAKTRKRGAHNKVRPWPLPIQLLPLLDLPLERATATYHS